MDLSNDCDSDSRSSTESIYRNASSYEFNVSDSISSDDRANLDFYDEDDFDEEADSNEEASVYPIEVFEKTPTLASVNVSEKIELFAGFGDGRAGEASGSSTNDLQLQDPLEVSPSKRSRKTDAASEMDVKAEPKAATSSAKPLSRTNICLTSAFSWTGINSFAGQRETFLLEKTGTVVKYETAYDSFRAIWTDEILDLIVLETNRYAMNARRRDRLYLTWRDTDRNEILILFTFFLMLDIVRMPTINSCYCSHWLMKTDVFRTLLSRERFLELTRCLRFANNDRTRTKPQNMKLSKVSPIINHLNAKFRELYVPSQNISIYQSQTLWYDQLGVKQNINTKVAKFGIKTFELCDSETSYLWSFIVDIGSQTSFVDSLTQGVLKSTSKVLLLIKPLLNKGYTLWMDSWFNSPLLARYLKGHKTDCVGTLDTKKAHVHPAFDRINLAAGQYFGRHAGDVALLSSWKDNEKVTTISTYHGAERELEPSGIYEPKVISDYNKYTRGIDKKDQSLEHYLSTRKNWRKWHLQLFTRLLNVSIHNSLVMYRQSSSSPKETQNMVFRFMLAQDLADRHLNLTQLAVKIEPTLTDSFSNPSRLLPDKHFPMTNLTSTDSQTDQIDGEHPASVPQNCCVWCKDRNQVEKKTNYICKLCKVPLCIEPCFEYYHSCD